MKKIFLLSACLLSTAAFAEDCGALHRWVEFVMPQREVQERAKQSKSKFNLNALRREEQRQLLEDTATRVAFGKPASHWSAIDWQRNRGLVNRCWLAARKDKASDLESQLAVARGAVQPRAPVTAPF